MAYVYARVNKHTLKFIRTQRNISFEYITRISKFTRDKVEQWENIESDKWPTINQAKALAKCYHVPFAGLYMNSEDINVKHLPRISNKRTLVESINDESAINLAIMDLIYARDYYMEVKKAFGETIPKFDLSLLGNDIFKWSAAIRNYLGFSIDEQCKLKSTRKLYLYLREKIENKGIFVQCFEGVAPEIMRGVAIYDTEVPIIGINDEDRYPAKIFTMLHEIVHIIKRSSSMCNEINNTYLGDAEEIFCNAVAGEILIPTSYILLDYDGLGESDFDLIKIDKIAKRYSVSSEVTARGLLDVGICSKEWYRKVSEALNEKFFREKEEAKLQRLENGKKGIPRNMPREGIDRTSSDMCRLLVMGYSEGFFDKSDISTCVGIKVKHINGFIGEVLKWFRQ